MESTITCRTRPSISSFLSSYYEDLNSHTRLIAGMSQSGDRLKQLEEIEKDIVNVIRSAGETLEELSKDAPSEDVINSTAARFLKSLETVEKGLTEQIGYLTQVATGQPHEGSTYGIEKDFELCHYRTKTLKEQVVKIRDQANNHQEALK